MLFSKVKPTENNKKYNCYRGKKIKLGTDGWYTNILGSGSVDVAYNIADAINKIGFGLVIYALATKSQKA